MNKYKLVLVRHGESQWNKENRFAGWVDVDLSEKGVGEAHSAGKALKEAGFTFDLSFTSFLKRANRTLDIILGEMGESNIEIRKSWKLNERHYGSLQGLNKSEMATKYGEAQVKLWRRGYDTVIPPLTKDSEMYPGRDPLYKDLKESEIPLSENLKMVVERVVPYWQESIVPEIKGGHKIIIAASGNSLRALMKHIEGISDEEITGIDVPTGIPLVYELDENLKVISKKYLADEEKLKVAIEAVANQGKAK
ncbi:MAG: 2,3-diphosphoglycerate-dependent phosphoglycerate mutase [Candidatus Paceibacterota bacterium]|jgi:2,3-bisphosphoglycerate-dependent phosphoglycerate mutase